MYFAGPSVSVVGDTFYSVALTIAILQPMHSAASVATILGAGAIPVVLLTLIGGTVGDRFPRNRVMIASDLVRSATQLAMAALLVRSHPPLSALIAAQFCYGVGDAFFDPASTGILPEIVSSEDLPTANSLPQLSANGARVVGPVAAGILIRSIRSDRAANGGMLTPGERYNINQRQNSVSRQIYRQKHNDNHAPR